MATKIEIERKKEKAIHDKLDKILEVLESLKSKSVKKTTTKGSSK